MVKVLRMAMMAVLPVAVGSFADMVAVDLNMAYGRESFSPSNPLIENYGTVILDDELDLGMGSGRDVKVTVTLNTAVLGAGADLEYLYFNSADFNGIGSIGFYDYSNPDVIGNFTRHEDYFKAGSDGFYDYRVFFGQGANPTVQSVEFYFYATGNSDLSVADFVNLANPSLTYDNGDHGNKGNFTIAAHVQTTSTIDGSEWIGGNGRPYTPPPSPVPEPTTLVLLGLSLLALGFLPKRKK